MPIISFYNSFVIFTLHVQLKPSNQDSFKGDFLLIDMLFWEHFLYNAM